MTEQERKKEFIEHLADEMKISIMDRENIDQVKARINKSIQELILKLIADKVEMNIEKYQRHQIN